MAGGGGWHSDGEADAKLPAAGFKTLCGKLEKLYKESPVELYTEHLAKQEAEGKEDL